MLTDFDKLVQDVSKTEDEKKPFVFSKLHGIPKQVADSSNSIGVNEKTLKNGLMSGVIQPSQIAHDRWLSILDGLADVSIIFSFTLIVSLIGINIYALGVLLVMYAYMFFHFMWWEHPIQWYFIETIREYVTQTRNFYYGTLMIAIVLIPSFGFNYVLEYKIDEKILYVKNKIVDFSNYSGVKSTENSSITFKTKQSSTFSKNENEFATKPKEPVVTKVAEQPQVKNELSAEKINTAETFSTFLFLNLLHLVVLFIFFKITNKMYIKQKDKNLTDVDSELKSELEIKMAMLRDK